MTINYIDIHTHNIFRSGVTSIRNYMAEDLPPVFEPLHSVGIHPYNVSPLSIDLLSGLVDSSPVAIGETGLDYRCTSDRRLQQELFEAQIALASTNRLPIIVHTVHAIDDTLAALSSASSPIIIHGFMGHPNTAQRFLDRGYYLSFGASAINSPKSLESLKSAPMDRIFFETDDSQISIEELYAIFAPLLSTDVEALKQQIYNNFNTIFDLR